jgi:hypothetical protein
MALQKYIDNKRLVQFYVELQEAEWKGTQAYVLTTFSTKRKNMV